MCELQVGFKADADLRPMWTASISASCRDLQQNIAEQVWIFDIDMLQLQRLTATTWLVVGFPLVSFCVCDSFGADIQFPISVAANRDQLALAFLR